MESGSEYLQFDSFLGGTQNVPSGQNLSEFIKHRMEEVVMLTEAIQESPFRGQAFQRLPKQMRRRQMSHYVKRLPKRLQRSYLMSLKCELPPPSKCPSRKYRRRPSNLLLEYNRRQRASTWLETHIWHAKRFHMCTKWGYKLPEKPVNKSFKACYRAIKEHSLLIDHSYYNCIELEGPESELRDGLMRCTSPECGLSFCAKTFASSKREGCTTLFYPDSYPYQVIGNVRFMWQPVTDTSTRRKIWIWVHPLMYEEALECFRFLFGLTVSNTKPTPGEVMEIAEEELTDSRMKKGDKKSKKRIESIKLLPKNVPFVTAPKYSNLSVTMTSLKDTLNRFQLTGPLSHAIVSQAFSVAPVGVAPPEVEVVEAECKRRKTESEEEAPVEVKKRKEWWEEYYEDSNRKKSWIDQKSFYEKMAHRWEPTDVPSGMILGLIVDDPRLMIPSKREKATPGPGGSSQMAIQSLSENLSHSPIWIPQIRDEVSSKKLTTQEINLARSKKIVPGLNVQDIIPDENRSRIPILLVQRPGREDSRHGKLGLGSGWDIIAPAGYGMPIWLSLIFRGARTGGLRESKLLDLECNSLNSYPAPDSAAGEHDSQENLEISKAEYFRLPPNKRVNFIKLGVLSPFYPPWKVLLKDWILATTPEKDKSELEQLHFSVLRNQQALKVLEEVTNNASEKGSEALKTLDLSPNCLVPVVIECLRKGRPSDLALLSLPEDEDLKNLPKAPTEPIHADENEKLRKTLKREHSTLLKSLKRRRRKERAKLKEELANDLPGELKWKQILKSNIAPSGPHSERHRAEMEGLWLPGAESLGSLVDSCSRRILGWIVRGEFSYSRSRGLGLGYMTLPGLLKVLDICQKNKSKAVVLVRNRDEVQYRFGRLRIAVP